MENQQPLDIVDMQEELSYDLATSGQRLGNFLIDNIIIRILMYGIPYLMPELFTGQDPLTVFLFLISLDLVYYIILEFTTGRTLGKYITGTVVLREVDLEKISFAQVLGRTFARLVPFEAFSFLGSNTGWHDRWTNTIVIKANTLRS